jgi:hypothetical protein
MRRPLVAYQRPPGASGDTQLDMLAGPHITGVRPFFLSIRSAAIPLDKTGQTGTAPALPSPSHHNLAGGDAGSREGNPFTASGAI